MRTLFKAAMVTLVLAGWSATGTGANAQPAPSSDGQTCDQVMTSVQYAKTRIGNLCLFRGNWVCYAEFTPSTECDKTQPDNGFGDA